MVLELDAGDVLVAREVPMRAGETAGELSERLALVACDAALDALARVERGDAVYTPQDPAGVTTCRRLKKEDGNVDWTRPADELERLVLAMNPWPGARTALPDGRSVTVWRARARAAGAAEEPPGTVVDAADELVVACGAGTLAITELQVEGKRALGAAEFLRGARLARGALLESR